jgi:hypothetical protein
VNENVFRYLVLLALILMRCDLHTVTEKVTEVEATGSRVESAVEHFNDHIVCLTSPDAEEDSGGDEESP